MAVEGNSEIAEGSLVCHRGRPAWALGKVLYLRGTDVQVYFKGLAVPTPEEKVIRLQISADMLELMAPRPDLELDHLPPYDADKMKFTRPATKVDLVRSRLLFRTRYPLGFGDELYNSPKDEREYKVAAHQRFVETKAHLESLVEGGTGAEIRTALEYVYRGNRGADMAPLNLMHPRFEAPHYYSALQDDVDARNYLGAALRFIAKLDEETFGQYARAVARMQWIEERADKGLWPIFSWLPFIADPASHMMIRPSVIRDFASAMGFDLRLQSELDFWSYVRVLKMSQLFKDSLQDSELNLSQRTLDMIDVQSFMWVAIKYFEPNALERDG